MSDVFIYMFFLGAGLATGVGVIALIGWRLVKRINRKADLKIVNKRIV